VLADPPCPELDELHHRAACVFREVRNIRRSRDLSFLEDAQLNARKYDSVTAIIKHLLAGHDGQPCPAGARPIVSPRREGDSLAALLAQLHVTVFFREPSEPPLLKYLHTLLRPFRSEAESKRGVPWVNLG
jgi:hypothetical protein